MLNLARQQKLIRSTVGVDRRAIVLDEELSMSRATILDVLRGEAAMQITGQDRLGNTPSRVLVDNIAGRAVRQAEKRVDIYFDGALIQIALATVRRALMLAVGATTHRRTGQLLEGWHWIYVRRDGNGRTLERRELMEAPLATVGQLDRLYLVPSTVAAKYAAFVNMRIKRRGVLGRQVGRTGTIRTRDRELKIRQAKTEGFLGAASRAVRANGSLGGIFCRVVFSRRFAPAGASRLQGVPVLVIGPRRGRRA